MEPELTKCFKCGTWERTTQLHDGLCPKCAFTHRLAIALGNAMKNEQDLTDKAKEVDIKAYHAGRQSAYFAALVDLKALA